MVRKELYKYALFVRVYGPVRASHVRFTNSDRCMFEAEHLFQFRSVLTTSVFEACFMSVFETILEYFIKLQWNNLAVSATAEIIIVWSEPKSYTIGQFSRSVLV